MNHSFKVFDLVGIAILFLLFLFIVRLVFSVPLFSIHHSSDSLDHALVFEGSGEVVIPVDFLQPEIDVEYSSVHRDVGIAKEDVAQKVSSVYAALQEEDLGVLEKNIKTTDYSIRPEYSNTYNPLSRRNESTLVGYRVSHKTTVQIHSVEDLGGVLDLFSASEPERVGSVSFIVVDERRKALEQEALAYAIQDAKEKARFTAREASLSLGKVLKVEEVPSNTYRPPVLYAASSDSLSRAATSKQTPFQAGTQVITKEVLLYFDVR